MAAPELCRVKCQWFTAPIHPRFHSRKTPLLIVKNRYIVHEAYQASYDRDSLIPINSCTKSVISILFGMVFKEQLTKNESQSAISYFPEYQIKDTAIHTIKVKHFLSMSSGLQWKGGIDATDVIAMSKTDDWAKYVFDRNTEHSLGEAFYYNSGGSQVVASILHKTLDTGYQFWIFKNIGWTITYLEVLIRLLPKILS
ncbi:MAG: serine hydrolase [Bacteroidota bacterium]